MYDLVLYNQALVGGLSDSFDPATRIGNVQLPGGSTVQEVRTNQRQSFPGQARRRSADAALVRAFAIRGVSCTSGAGGRAGARSRQK